MSALATSAAIAVIGAGTMGAGIAQIAASAGHKVFLYDTSEAALNKGLALITKILARSVEKGRIEETERDAILGRITLCKSLEELAPAALVIEAIVESLDIKRSVFCALEDIVDESAILATNTSSISITEIAAPLKRPERMVGMHFFNPAPIMKLVEVVHGLASDVHIAQTVFDTAESWGKKAVHATSTPGFIVNRVARPFYSESLRILQEGGADIATIDACVREAGGFRMGPFELMDLIGNDINFSVTKSVFEAFYQEPRYRPNLIQQEQVAAGRLGRKSGQGYYDYREGAEKMRPTTADKAPAPIEITVLGDTPQLAPLVELAEKANITIHRDDNEEVSGFLIDCVLLIMSDGTSATEMADLLDEPVVVFDHALDYKACTRLALAKADQSDDSALITAAGFFQALGKQVSIIDDCPGLIVTRIVTMLINEASDAVHQGVASPQAVDDAMRYGLNYPSGPFAWADHMGLAHVFDCLEALKAFYGEERYRISPFLRRCVTAGKNKIF